MCRASKGALADHIEFELPDTGTITEVQPLPAAGLAIHCDHCPATAGEREKSMADRHRSANGPYYRLEIVFCH